MTSDSNLEDAMHTDKRNSYFYMGKAIELASKAAAMDEVPVGAVIVHKGSIIAKGYNQKEALLCSTKHAEIIAIEEASKQLGSWRLVECELYVTLEPCLMCAGAIVHSRLSKIYFGTPDPKGGATGSLYSVHNDSRLNHQFEVESNIRKEECSQLLRRFFQEKRKNKKMAKKKQGSNH